jgi:hypothetical protein
MEIIIGYYWLASDLPTATTSFIEAQPSLRTFDTHNITARLL